MPCCPRPLYVGDMQLSKWEGDEKSLVSDWADYEAYLGRTQRRLTIATWLGARAAYILG